MTRPPSISGAPVMSETSLHAGSIVANNQLQSYLAVQLYKSLSTGAVRRSLPSASLILRRTPAPTWRSARPVEAAHSPNLEARVPDRLGRSSASEELDPGGSEALGERQQASLVVHGQKRCEDAGRGSAPWYVCRDATRTNRSGATGRPLWKDVERGRGAPAPACAASTFFQP